MDAETGQAAGATLCEDCFGTTYTGGFEDPVEQWIELTDQNSVLKDDPKGHGTDAVNETQFRVLAYPEIRRGDMYVIEESDERYLIDTYKPFKFNGRIPFVYEGQMEKLRRNDVRYLVGCDGEN